MVVCRAADNTTKSATDVRLQISQMFENAVALQTLAEKILIAETLQSRIFKGIFVYLFAKEFKTVLLGGTPMEHLKACASSKIKGPRAGGLGVEGCMREWGWLGLQLGTCLELLQFHGAGSSMEQVKV